MREGAGARQGGGLSARLERAGTSFNERLDRLQSWWRSEPASWAAAERRGGGAASGAAAAAEPAGAARGPQQGSHPLVRALFFDEVTCRMPRRLKDKRRRGVLVINGLELAVLDTQRAGWGAGGALGPEDGTGDVGVIAQYPLSKLLAIKDCGDPRQVELEFLTTSRAAHPALFGLDNRGAPGRPGSAGPAFDAGPPVFGSVDSQGAGGPLAAAAAADEDGFGGSAGDAALLPTTPLPAPLGAPRQHNRSISMSDLPPPSPASSEPSSSLATPQGAAAAAAAGAAGSGGGGGSGSGSGLGAQRPSWRSYLPRASSFTSLGGLGAAGAGGGAQQRTVRDEWGELRAVFVEAIWITFSDATMRAVAVQHLRQVQQNLGAALPLLKQGFPITSEFEVSHVTSLEERGAGPEALVSGPVPWDSELPLPESWSEAIAAASKERVAAAASPAALDSLLATPLDAPGGPAAFRVYLSTPAGLAVATLVPELVAALAQQAEAPAGDVLAVPVRALLLRGAAAPAAAATPVAAAAAADAAAAAAGTRGVPADGGACGGAATLHVHAVGSASDTQGSASGGGSSSDAAGMQQQQQQPAGAGRPPCPAVSVAQHKAGAPSEVPSPAGEAPIDGLPSAGLPLDPASDIAVASSWGDALTDPPPPPRMRLELGLGISGGGAGPGPGRLSRQSSHRFGSSGNLLLLERQGSIWSDASSGGASSGRAGASRDEDAAAAAGPGDAAATDAKAAAARGGDGDGGSDAGGSAGTAEVASRSASVATASADFGDTAAAGLESASLSFAAEVLVVLKVQVKQQQQVEEDEEGQQSDQGEEEQPPSGRRRWGNAGPMSPLEPVMEQGGDPSPWAPAGAARRQQRPGGGSSGGFLRSAGRLVGMRRGAGAARPAARPAARQPRGGGGGGGSGGGGGGGGGVVAPAVGSACSFAADDGAGRAPAPPVVIGAGLRSARAAAAERVVLLSASVFTLLLCGLAALGGASAAAAAPWLLCCAAAANVAALVAGTVPSVALGLLRRRRRRRAAAAAAASAAQRVGQAPSLLASTLATLRLAPTDPPAPALTLRLVGAAFARDAMGVLEEQVMLFKALYSGQPTAAAAAAAADAAAPALAAAGGGAARASTDGGAGAQEGPCVVLISDPEPSWMTLDLRRRFLMARPTLTEQQALARVHHNYRLRFRVDSCLSRPPPHFEFFHHHFGYKILGTTPQGHVVLMIRLAALCALPRALRDAGLSTDDFSAHMAWVWTYMFSRLAPHAHPGGRMVLVADCRGIRLSIAMGEGQVAGTPRAPWALWRMPTRSGWSRHSLSTRPPGLASCGRSWPPTWRTPPVPRCSC